MATTPTTIECFVADAAFTDLSRTFNGVLLDEIGSVAALTPKALSYFTQPNIFKDKRDPGSRTVNWPAETSAQIIVDKEYYEDFIDVINDQDPNNIHGIFKIIDLTLFAHADGTANADLETAISLDGDMSMVYVPGSLRRSTDVVSDTLYFSSGAVGNHETPAFVSFSITLLRGSVREQFDLTFFVSVPHFLAGYDNSNIVVVIPPLPYARLYSASLVTSSENIFAVATQSTELVYTTTQSKFGNTQVSGSVEFRATLVDSSENTVVVPFIILYKGRSPTRAEVRFAIRNELLNSGIGTPEGWEARIPGVFVAGRFYIVPFWDLRFERPNRDPFNGVNSYKTLGERVNTILDSTNTGDLRDYASIFTTYFNRMMVGAAPDIGGQLDFTYLENIIPDYQNFSPTEDNFAYMSKPSRDFSTQLSEILAIETNNVAPGAHVPTVENLLEFYTFVVDKYELCVITKQCYTTIMESVQ